MDVECIFLMEIFMCIVEASAASRIGNYMEDVDYFNGDLMERLARLRRARREPLEHWDTLGYLQICNVLLLQNCINFCGILVSYSWDTTSNFYIMI